MTLGGLVGVSAVGRLFSESRFGFRARLVSVFGAVAVLNVGAWLWALAAYHGEPVLLGIALMIYGLGLRHAVDADHIAAIDNVTRKLTQERKRPVSVGFFFAMGHSAIVTLITGIVAGAATMLGGIESLKDLGSTVSTAVSALFLFTIAAMNMVILAATYRSYRRVRAGAAHVEEDLDMLVGSRGLLSRIFRPLFKLVTESWHMFLLGFVFGLGFDTATEVAMFGIAAGEAAKGISLASTLAFPALFAAGMSLVDTTDGVLMLGAYEWAFVKPLRKLYYNMTITLTSVVVAVLIAGIEALHLIEEKAGLDGAFWDILSALNGSFNRLGYLIIGVFLAAWLLSYLVYRICKIDNDEVEVE